LLIFDRKNRQILSEAREGIEECFGADASGLAGRPCVSKGRLTRALRIMAALLHLLEERRLQGGDREEELGIDSCVSTARDSFGVVEKSRQIKVVETPGRYTYHRVRLEPTGVLSLEIWSWWRAG